MVGDGNFPAYESGNQRSEKRRWLASGLRDYCCRYGRGAGGAAAPSRDGEASVADGGSCFVSVFDGDRLSPSMLLTVAHSMNSSARSASTPSPRRNAGRPSRSANSIAVSKNVIMLLLTRPLLLERAN
jgi:hypothetical protein